MIKEGVTGVYHLIPESMSQCKEELIASCLQAGRRAFGRHYPDSVRLLPGVRALFQRLKEEGLAIGIVTSSHRRFIERKLLPMKKAAIYEMIDAVIVIEDTEKRKPHPEPVMACAQRLGVDERRSVYVGDADVEIKAGKQAGAFTVAVLTGVHDYETLVENRPDLIVPGVRDCSPGFDGVVMTDPFPPHLAFPFSRFFYGTTAMFNRPTRHRFKASEIVRKHKEILPIKCQLLCFVGDNYLGRFSLTNWLIGFSGKTGYELLHLITVVKRHQSRGQDGKCGEYRLSLISHLPYKIPHHLPENL